MTTRVRAGDGPVAAKGFQPDSNDLPSPLESLSPLLTGECAASLERIFRKHKPIAVGEKCNRKKSTVYKWAETGDVPVGALAALAIFDPDDELLQRIAGHLLAVSAQRAIARKAQEAARNVFQEVNGRWIR